MRRGAAPTPLLTATFVLAGLLGAACLGTSEPGFTEYVATLQSPHGAEGAAVIEVAGEAITTFSSRADQFHVGPAGATTRLLIVLTDPGTIRFTLTAENRGDRPTATVVAVADGANQPRPSLDGYAVEIREATP